MSNIAMLFDPFGFKAAAIHTRCGWTDLVLRLKADALCLKTAMIDARIDIEFGKALVHVIGTALAPSLDKFGAVPLADFRAEARFAIVADDDFAHREHDMRVGLGEPVGADVPMDIEVGDHALFDELGLGKLAGQLDALFFGQLAWNREFDLAG